MRLNELSNELQKKLAIVGFKLNEDINEIQHTGNALGFYIYAPIHYAASIGDIVLIDELLRNKADIHQFDEFGRTALMWAAEYGRTKAIKILIDNGAKPEQKTKYDEKIVKSNPHLDWNVKTALEFAEENRKPSCIWLFCQKRILKREINYEGTINLLRSKL